MRAIETTQQLVALFASRGVELVHWGERRNADEERMLLPAPPSDLEDLVRSYPGFHCYFTYTCAVLSGMALLLSNLWDHIFLSSKPVL